MFGSGVRYLGGAKFTVGVNNVFNKMPPKDGSYAGTYPYYNNENYNVYGREVMLQLQWRFGGHTRNG